MTNEHGSKSEGQTAFAVLWRGERKSEARRPKRESPACAQNLRATIRQITAYTIPGFFGHGAGESAADALAVVGETARHLPTEGALFFCPLTSGDFYRAALQAGHRLRKVMTYMTRGPFGEPEKIWMPSIAY